MSDMVRTFLHDASATIFVGMLTYAQMAALLQKEMTNTTKKLFVFGASGVLLKLFFNIWHS